MNTLLAAYSADAEDEDADDSSIAKTRQRGDSDASLSDMEESSVHSGTLEVTDTMNPQPGSEVDTQPTDNKAGGGVENFGGSTNEDSSSQQEKPANIARNVTATRLVSYGPDVDDDDDDDDREGSESGREDESIGLTDLSSTAEIGGMTKSELNDSLSSLRHSLSESEVQLPPEPQGSCSRKLQDKVTALYAKMLRTGTDLNAVIQRRKDFRNPSIYEKLIEFSEIDERGTNYPPELYNPSIWGPESSYEYLAKVQKQDMDRREKERKERLAKEKNQTQVERIVGLKKPAAAGGGSQQSSPEAGRKRSKWDQTGSSAASVIIPSVQIPAVGVIAKPKLAG